MKKTIIGFLLVISILLSLCACGGGAEKQEKSFAVLNETIKTDKEEFTLIDFRYAKTIGFDFAPNSGISSKSNNFFTADDGKVFAWVSFTIKNIGKTKLDDFASYEGGSSCFISKYLTFECDGYKFGGADTEGNPFGSSDDNINWYTGATLDLDVLSAVKYYRGVIEIPEELAKSNEPIYLHVQMATENEGMTIMGYELSNPEYKPDK